MTTRAIGYIRVSTSEQADSGLSLAAQRKKIEAQATLSDWPWWTSCRTPARAPRTCTGRP